MLIKSKHKKCENIIEMNNDNDYKTGSLLDYEYFSNLYKLIVTGLSKQIELKKSWFKTTTNYFYWEDRKW